MNQDTKSKKITLRTPTVKAKAVEHAAGKIEVLAGSVMKAYSENEMAKNKKLYEQLLKNGIIEAGEGTTVRFIKSHTFANANEAASFLLHRGGDNTSVWHNDGAKKTAAKKPAAKKTESKKAEPKKAQPKKAAARPATKAAPKKNPHTTEKKKQDSSHKNTAVKTKSKSARRDPRNPRGIKPQGNAAVQSAEKVSTNFIRFAGMGQKFLSH